MPRCRHLLIALLLALLAACGIPVPKEKAAYVGRWQAEGIHLEISAAGRVVFRRERGNASMSLDAPLQAFNGNDFKAGVGPMSTEFKVSVPPHQVGAEWRMTVDGVELVRVQPR